MKKSVVLLLGVGVVILLAGGYFLYTGLSGGGDEANQSNNVTSSVRKDMKIQDVTLFKTVDKTTQLNVIGQIQNNSDTTRSITVRIVITRPDTSRQVYVVAINSVSAHTARHFGITKEGYPEKTDDLQVATEVVSVF